MTASTAAPTSATSKYGTRLYWERLWRMSGIQFVAFFIVNAVILGYQPGVGASADALSAFYEGDRTRILIAAALSGLNLLNLLWFAAALRTTLADAGQDGWGAATTASSVVFGTLFLMALSLRAALAYSIVGIGNIELTSALNDSSWVVGVLSAFPLAMLIMAGSFGLWRAGFISNSLFAAGVTAMLLVLLSGGMLMSDGFWTPDGAYSRFVPSILLLVWVVGVSRVLLTRSPATRAGW